MCNYDEFRFSDGWILCLADAHGLIEAERDTLW